MGLVKSLQQAWVAQQDFKLMDWHAVSPDLSRIESIWSWMEDNLNWRHDLLITSNKPNPSQAHLKPISPISAYFSVRHVIKCVAKYVFFVLEIHNP